MIYHTTIGIAPDFLSPSVEDINFHFQVGYSYEPGHYGRDYSMPESIKVWSVRANGYDLPAKFKETEHMKRMLTGWQKLTAAILNELEDFEQLEDEILQSLEES